jgi:membrane-associated phospholipid phosphatase
MTSEDLKRMHPRRLRGFIARRWSHDEYLGIHFTVGLLFSLCLLGVFAVIAQSVRASASLNAFDLRLGLELKAYRQTAPVTRSLVIGITELGSVPMMVAFTVLGALILLLRHHRLLALVWLIAIAGGGLLDMCLKDLFERERPLFRDPFIDTTTKSFPSGHSMGSLIGYGFLAYLLVLALPRVWMRISAVCALTVLVLAIGFSRVYLGAHYVSDVLGGYAVGGVWLATCITAVETMRRRPRYISTEDKKGQKRCQDPFWLRDA